MQSLGEPPTLLERFPPLDLDEVIARIDSFQQADDDGRRETIERFVGAHPVLSYRWGGPWRYRRARRITGEDSPDHVSGLIWRPDVPAAQGRANAAGYRVLYLADRRDTALSEVRARDDDVILSEFVIRPDRSIMVAPVGEIAQVQRSGRGILSSEAATAISDMINACDRRSCRSMLIVDAFLLRCLSNREDDYVRSSTVAMALFGKLPSLDAVAFPSRRRSGAVNFAVRADRLWNDWGVASVQRARAKHLAMGYYELTNATHVRAITNAGGLVWSDEQPTDEEAILMMIPPWHPLVPTDGGSEDGQADRVELDGRDA